MSQRIAIIGAGPTGLGAAHRLSELGHSDWDIYEGTDRVGGLAASVRDEQGFIWDHGGHVMFSHYEYFDDLVEKALRGDYDQHMREAWVWISDRYVPFPIQNNIHRLPTDEFLECFEGIIRATRDKRSVESFAEHIDAYFGEGLGKHFMYPYNEKVWAHDLETLGTGWLGERVPSVDPQRIIDNLLADRDDISWGPNASFKFPLLGTGMLYERIAAGLARPVELNRRVIEIDVQGRSLSFSDGTGTSFDHLVSTMPLPELVRCIPGVPDEITVAADSLHHTSGHFIGVGVDEPTESSKCWIYYPQPDVPFYRVTYLSNYSEHLTPGPNQFALLAEVSSSSHRPVDPSTLVPRTIEAMVRTGLLTSDQAEANILSTHHMSVPYSYPVPTKQRDAALTVIQRWLMSLGIYSRGRFGAWKYEIGNTDHSVMMGVEVVDHLELGEPEKTWSLV